MILHLLLCQEKIVIDPDFNYPDVDATNNYWYKPE